MKTIIMFCLSILLLSCSVGKDKEQPVKDDVDKEEPTTVIRKDPMGLIILYPQYSLSRLCNRYHAGKELQRSFSLLKRHTRGIAE